MQVILLRDVAKIGKKGEVRDVPQGHAQNFLIPRKLAEPATREAVRKHSIEAKKKEINNERRGEAFDQIIKVLTHESLKIEVEANEKGHLFRGLHPKDIQKALEAKGMYIHENEIHLESPIKVLGEARVLLRSGSHEGEVTIVIEKAS